jgi:hypothetical protein
MGESVKVLMNTGRMVCAATKLSPKNQNPASRMFVKKFRRRCFTTSGFRLWFSGSEKKLLMMPQ